MSSTFGELVLLVGDHHVPMRSRAIPAQFRKMLLPGRVQRVLCTGNLGTRGEYDNLKTLVGGNSSNVHCVSGEYDDAYHQTTRASSLFGSSSISSPTVADDASSGQIPTFPDTRVIQLGDFRVGIIGGHQVVPWGDLSALSMVRRKLGVDVMVCGRRRAEGVVEYEGENGGCVCAGWVVGLDL
jgi:vacuolar protein sorting-associated protein 29